MPFLLLSVWLYCIQKQSVLKQSRFWQLNCKFWRGMVNCRWEEKALVCNLTKIRTIQYWSALLINTWNFFYSPVTLVLLFCLSLPLTEWHMGRAVLLCSVQSHEPHVVYWVWRSGSRGDDWCVAHHAQHDRRRHLLRHVHRPRHCSHPVTGLLATAVPGKGETWLSICPSISPFVVFIL